MAIACRVSPGGQHALCADVVGHEPADDPAAQRGQARCAELGGRHHGRDPWSIAWVTMRKIGPGCAARGSDPHHGSSAVGP
jgi:hypothetical protein